MKISILAASLLFLSVPLMARCDEPDDSFLLSLERTPCYGTCPAYQVTLEPDNTVTFIGKSNVAAMGEHVTSVDTQAMQQLLAKFDAAGFLDLPADMESHCESSVTDVPGMIIFYRKGEKSRKVMDTSGCRGNKSLDKVRELGREIDKTLETGQWIK